MLDSLSKTLNLDEHCMYYIASAFAFMPLFLLINMRAFRLENHSADVIHINHYGSSIQ